MILSGRRVNDAMPGFIAKRLVQMLIQKGKNPKNTKVLIMGTTFKENVADIRNSKVIDVARELMDFSVHIHLTDPHASPNELAHEYRMTLVDQVSDDYDAVIVAVAHEEYRRMKTEAFLGMMGDDPILFDLKALYEYPPVESELTYWRL